MEREKVEAEKKYLKIAIPLFAIVFLLFSLSDYINYNDQWKILFIIRSFGMIPVFFVILLLYKSNVSYEKTQKFLAFGFVTIGFSTVHIIILTQSSTSFGGGLFIVYFIGYLMLKLNLFYSVVSGFSIFILHTILLIAFSIQITQDVLWGLLFYFIANLIGAFGNYSIQIIKKKNEDYQQALLEQTNAVKKALEHEKTQFKKFKKELKNNEVLNRKNKMLVELVKKVSESEKRFSFLLDVAAGGIIMHDEGVIIDCSEKIIEMTGFKKSELIGSQSLKLVDAEYHNHVKENISNGLEEPYEILGVKRNGERYPLKVEARNIPYEGKIVRVVEFTDLSKIKSLEDETLKKKNALTSFQNSHKLLIDQMPLSILNTKLVFDDDGSIKDYKILSVNPQFEKMSGWKGEDLEKYTLKEAFEESESHWDSFPIESIKRGKSGVFEVYSKSLKKHLKVKFFSPEKGFSSFLVEDVTKIKKAENEKDYLVNHDTLTNLKNRRYFNITMQKLDVPANLPISIINFDINGLKVINDSFGHKVGDNFIEKVGKVLKKSFKDSLIARIGGDEFSVLLKNTTKKEALKYANSFLNEVSNIELNGVRLSMTLGIGTKTENNINIFKVMNEAEDELYTNKLFQKDSHRSETVKSILNILHEKNPEEAVHSKRVSDICYKIGMKMKLPNSEIEQLKTASYLHDIGKVSLEKSILEKPTKLNKEEWGKVKRHPEIGYKIVMASKDYSLIANGILHHHERFDGNGYPNKLKGKEIPLFSRIIGVADAYDAMTSHRSYRSALSRSEAMKEILTHKGTQFDPEIVEIFTKLYEKEEV